MRLGQIARKLEVKPETIVSFLNKTFKADLELDPNLKLEDSYVDAVKAQFEKVVEVEKVVEPEIKKTEPEIIPEEEVEEIVAADKEPEIISSSAQEVEEVEEKEDKIAADDTLEEEDASRDSFEPLEVDPNAELIKAPKVKLEGLKVVGKIDIPEKKVEEREEISELDAAMEKAQQDIKDTQEVKEAEEVSDHVDDEEEFSIYKDKRGFYHFTDQQKQNRKDSLERIKIERRIAAQKKKKERYYQELVAAKKESKEEAKPKKKQRAPKKQSAKDAEKPKGIWGKFVHWLND